MKCFNITDAGYMPLVKNQIKNFDLSYMRDHELNLYCLDSKSYEECRQLTEGKSGFLVHDVGKLEWDGRSASYGDEKFKQLMRIRPKMFHSIVRSLGGALHTEADVFWFKDPSTVVDLSAEYDWLMQHDASGPDYHVAWLNIGCSYYRDTPNSMKLFDLWIKHHDSSNLMDQEALCELLQITVNPSFQLFPILEDGFDFRDATQKLNVSIKCFDKRLVQNGHCAFKEGYINLYEPTAIHVNHHCGVEKKIELLKSCGAWVEGGD